MENIEKTSLYYKSLQILGSALLLMIKMIVQQQPSASEKDSMKDALHELLQTMPGEALEYIITPEEFLKEQIASDL